MRPLKTYEVHLLFVTGLYVLGLAVYSNSLSGPFVLDDYPNIRENPSIRMTGIDVDALYRAGFESVDTQPPLAYISFALNYYFGDYDVFAYHLVNVLLHIANGVLLYFLVLLIGRAEGSNQTPWAWVAFVAGVIFLVHPIQTQAVTYIVQRITSLAAFFYLLALLLYGLGRLNPALGKRVVLWCFCRVFRSMRPRHKRDCPELAIGDFVMGVVSLQGSWTRGAHTVLAAFVIVRCGAGERVVSGKHPWRIV